MAQQQDKPAEHAPKPKPSMTKRVVLALALGSLTGLFFGESTAWFAAIGDIYIGLLQMTVLPYITVTLIVSIGRLGWDQGKKLMAYGAITTAVLWVLGLATILIMPAVLPAWETGSFFKAEMLTSPPSVDFMDLFLPLNIFASLSRNVVPAVVVFCLAVGIALIGMPNKDKLLPMLEVLSEALMRINKAVVRFTPYGVFAIAVGVASTMTLSEIGQLQGYVIMYTLACVYLGLVFVPMVIAAVTPFTYRQIMGVSKDALITAFATGKVLIVLPLLIENTRVLFEDHAREQGLDAEGSASSVQAIYPLAYPFPSLGKVLCLMFVPFAAWFAGTPLEFADYPPMLTAGLFSMFGGPVVALPFLMELFRIPREFFQYFIATGVWTARVGDLLSATHLVAVAVITTSAMGGLLKIHWHRLLRLIVVTVVLGAATVFGVRAYLSTTIDGVESPADIVDTMDLYAVQTGLIAETEELTEATPNPMPRSEGGSTVDRILRRRVLRVGYAQERRPFAYRNTSGKLVGLDIDIANRLALDLGATLELVPIDLEKLPDHFARDHVDVALGGIEGTTKLALESSLSPAYLNVHSAFLVRDSNRRDWKTLAAIRALDKPRVGVLQSSELEDLLPLFFKGMTIERLDSPEPFLRGDRDDLDALFMSAEVGAFWSISYPRYRVVRPAEATLVLPVVLAYPKSADDLDEVIEHWVDLARTGGFMGRLVDHWILGKTATKKAPRWSIIRDVLEWTD